MLKHDWRDMCASYNNTKIHFTQNATCFLFCGSASHTYINHVYNLDYRLCQNKPRLEIMKNYDFLLSVRPSIFIALIVQARTFVSKLQTTWVFQLCVTHKTHSEVKGIHNVGWSFRMQLHEGKQTSRPIQYLFHDIWHVFLQVSFLPTKW